MPNADDIQPGLAEAKIAEAHDKLMQASKADLVEHKNLKGNNPNTEATQDLDVTKLPKGAPPTDKNMNTEFEAHVPKDLPKHDKPVVKDKP